MALEVSRRFITAEARVKCHISQRGMRGTMWHWGRFLRTSSFPCIISPVLHTHSFACHGNYSQGRSVTHVKKSRQILSQFLSQN